MFANKDKNSPATVGDLEELAVVVVNNFATKDDLKQELSRFATKDDLNNLDIKIDRRIGKLEAQIEDKFDKISTMNDLLVKKLDTYQVENAMLSGHTKENTDEVDKLKIRVTAVEKHIGIEPMAVSG